MPAQPPINVSNCFCKEVSRWQADGGRSSVNNGSKPSANSIYGKDKWVCRQCSFNLAKRARRVRLRGLQPKQREATTRRPAIMNLVIRGIEADIGKEHADTFRSVQHPDLRADYVLANPPFNDSDRFRKDDDVRWQFGVPSKGNANFAWVQHFIHYLAPQATLSDAHSLKAKPLRRTWAILEKHGSNPSAKSSTATQSLSISNSVKKESSCRQSNPWDSALMKCSI